MDVSGSLVAAGMTQTLHCTKGGHVRWSPQFSPHLKHSADTSLGVVSVLP